MARVWGRRGFLVVAWIFIIGLIAQVYLAGVGVFAGSFTTHRDMGYIVSLLPVLLLLFGAIGRVGRRDLVLSLVLLLQGILQSILVFQRVSAPNVAALHPVNGVVMLIIGLVLGVDAWRLLREDRPAAAEA
ncbi:MAG TPA: DUF6220 domain-containing protein [Candidatus Limnocylindrales bacterium]|jgi:hypothetical membrane protein